MDAVLCFDYTTVTMSHYGLVIVTICLRIPQQSHWSTSVATVPALETCVSFYKSKMRNTRQARHMVCLPALTGTHTQGRLGWVGLGGWAAKLFTRAKMKQKNETNTFVVWQVASGQMCKVMYSVNVTTEGEMAGSWTCYTFIASPIRWPHHRAKWLPRWLDT